MRLTGIVRDNRYLDHITGDDHPENLRRLEAVYAVLDEPGMKGCFTEIPPRAAETKELILIHAPEYVKRIAATAGREHTSLTPDTFASSLSYQAALLAVGGLFEAIVKVVSGEIPNAFVLNRPPGHHAEKSRAMGFCLFNNVALGAMFARRFLGLNRVLVVDWDVHHGNGTQHAFESDPSVLFFSVHQSHLFPNTGVFTEIGRAEGEGYTVNIPLSKGHGDEEYAALFETILRPIALEFRPDLILVSAGFDTHRSDPLGGMRMTDLGFAALTRSLMDMADACCNGRMVLVLEGGYNAKALAESVKAVLRELSGQTVCGVHELAGRASVKKMNHTIKRCAHVHGQFWKMVGKSVKF